MQIKLFNHGSIVLFYPLDQAAIKWLRETAPEDAQFSGTSLAVEPRYVLGVVEAFNEAGGEIV